MLIQELQAMKDDSYRAFQMKLIPNVNPEKIIGIRMPALRKFAKEYGKREEAKDFLKRLPHTYFEENNLHALLLEQRKEFDILLWETERFLPWIDNWATCDMFRPKVFRSYTGELYPKIKEWIASEKPYTVRYAVGLLLSFYLDEAFVSEQAELVAGVRSEEYYINMMIAWYFATALAKQYDAVLPYLKENRLSPWVHNKSIQKATESYRISPEIKNYLKTLKR